jgi:hypothetical protein
MANTRSYSDSDDEDDVAADSASGNYDILKDCLSTMIIEKLSPTDTRPSKKRAKGRKNEIKPVERPAPTEAEVESDVAELGEFTEVSLSGDEVERMLEFWEGMVNTVK